MENIFSPLLEEVDNATIVELVREVVEPVIQATELVDIEYGKIDFQYFCR